MVKLIYVVINISFDFRVGVSGAVTKSRSLMQRGITCILGCVSVILTT